jgi:hypothetical protein
MNIAGEPGAKNVMEIVPLEHLKVVEGIKKLLGEDKSELKKIEKIEWIKDNFNWERTISILQARMR